MGFQSTFDWLVFLLSILAILGKLPHGIDAGWQVRAALGLKAVRQMVCIERSGQHLRWVVVDGKAGLGHSGRMPVPLDPPGSLYPQM